MTNLLYLVSTLQRTGPTTQLLNLVRHLDPAQFTAQVVTLSPEMEDSLWDAFLAAGISVNSLHLSRLKGLLSGRRQVREIIVDQGIHLVHTQGIRADTLVAKLGTGAAQVATIRNFPQVDYPLTYGRFLGRLMAWQHVRHFPAIDCCAGVSHAVTDNIRALCPRVHARTVINGVETGHFQPPQGNEKNMARQLLNLPRDKTLWIASGHLNERKDPLTLVKGFNDAFRTDPDQVLVFIGTGPLEEATRQLAKDNPRILVRGRVTDVKRYLQACDYYVSSSLGEGLPNAALEAMACGLPVLLSDIPPHQQLVTMNPAAGKTFATGDVSSLAQGFHDMAQQPHSHMSKAAATLAEEHLSARSMAANYQDLYKSLLALKATTP